MISKSKVSCGDLSDTESLLVNLFSFNACYKLIFLVAYGSQKKHSDLDIFAVYEEWNDKNDFSIGALDLFVIDMQTFINLLGHHDVAVTEPVLTGKLIYGSSQDWENIKTSYSTLIPNGNDIFYLTMRAMNIIAIAESRIRNYATSRQRRDLYYAIRDMSFGLSYACFAAEYNNGATQLTLKSLLEKHKSLCDLLTLKKRIIRSDTLPQENELADILEKTKDDIIKMLYRGRAI